MSGQKKRRPRGTGSVYQRGRVWWVRYRYRGKEVREPVPARTDGGPASKSEAEKYLRARLGQIDAGTFRGPDVENTTFEDTARLLERDYEQNQRRSAKRMGQGLKHLRDYFSNAKAQDVSADAVERYKDHRLGQGASNSTIDYELALLKRAFKLATKRGLVSGVPPVDMLALDNTREGFFEEWEFREVVAHLPDEVKPVAIFGYYTGWRKEEILGLEWHQIDFETGAVRLKIRSSKNKAGRLFPFGILPELEAALIEQRAYTDRIERRDGKVIPWVFHREGRQIRYFRRSWLSACDKAGVEDRKFHDFRRSAVRNLVRAGVPEIVAMRLTGHKTRSVFERYAIVDETLLGEGVERLAAFHKAQAQKPKAVVPMRAGGRRNAQIAHSAGRKGKKMVPRDGIEPPTRGFSIPESDETPEDDKGE